MSNYTETSLNLSDGQRRKIQRAIAKGEAVTVEVKKSQVNTGKDVLRLTNTQVKKLKRLEPGKGVQIKMTKTQLSKQVKAKNFSMSEKEAEQARQAMEQLIKKENDLQTGGFLGAIAKLALPLVKNILPRVLGTLGLAAATGAISGATHKATSGQGLRRAGYGIDLSKRDLEQLIKLANLCECNKLLPTGTVNKYMQDIKKQKGGFIGALIASLAGSLLPTLLSGKGLRRAGNKR